MKFSLSLSHIDTLIHSYICICYFARKCEWKVSNSMRDDKTNNTQKFEIYDVCFMINYSNCIDKKNVIFVLKSLFFLF